MQVMLEDALPVPNLHPLKLNVKNIVIKIVNQHFVNLPSSQP